MKFGDMIQRASQSALVIGSRHDDWLMQQVGSFKYSEEALDFARMQLNTPDRVRRGTISASSASACMRQQQFTFLGMPQKPLSPKLAAIFQEGNFVHLKWQMAGLTEGWLLAAEIPIRPQGLLRGTMDGLCYEGSLLEIKSINPHGFSGVVTFGPKEEHLSQVATYMEAEELDKVVFVYEDKATQEYKEFVRTRDEMEPYIEETKKSREKLEDLIDNDQLAPVLGECLEGKGKSRWCPYAERCMDRSNIHAKDMREATW